MTDELLEYAVGCYWCGAPKGKPCVDQKGRPYEKLVHRVRYRDFNTTFARGRKA